MSIGELENKGLPQKAVEAIGKVVDGNKGGIPFFWALTLALVLLAGIWLGHHLTIKGQEQIKDTIILRQPAKDAASLPAPQDTRVVDSLEKTSENMGGLTRTVGGLNDNVASLVKDFDERMMKIQGELDGVSQSVDAMAKLQKSVHDLQEAIKTSTIKADPAISQKLDALAKALDGKKMDVAVDYAPLRKDITVVNQNVMTLAAIFREKLKGDEIKLSALGEEFPRK